MRAARAAVVLLAGWVSLSACRDDGPPGVEVPEPDLAGMSEPLVAAIHEAQAAVREEPTSAARWGRLGDIFLGHALRQAGAVAYGAAAALEPSNVTWIYRRATCLRLSHEPAAAEQAYRKALELRPDYAPGVLALGEVLAAQGREDEARAAYEKAVELDPSEPFTHLRLGQLAASQDRLEDAERHLADAIRIRPDLAEAHQALARVCFALGKEELAAQHAAFTSSLQKRNDWVDPLATPEVEALTSHAITNEGRDLEAAGKLREAEAAYRESLRLRPDSATARFNLGSLLIRTGRPAEGIEHLQEALRVQPSYDKARLNLGITLYETGRLAEAEPHLREVVGSDETRLLGRLHLGMLLARTGRSAEAAAMLRDGLAEQPGWLRGMGELAWVLATAPDDEVRDGAEALRLADRVCRETGFREPAAVDALAAAHAELGQYDRAVELLTRSLGSLPRGTSPERAEDMRRRLALYRSGRPFRQP